MESMGDMLHTILGAEEAEAEKAYPSYVDEYFLCEHCDQTLRELGDQIKWFREGFPGYPGCRDCTWRTENSSFAWVVNAHLPRPERAELLSLLRPQLMLQEIQRYEIYPSPNCADMILTLQENDECWTQDGLTYEIAAQLLANMGDCTMRAAGLWALSRCRSLARHVGGGTTLLDGTRLLKHELNLKALDSDPSFARAYYGLALTAHLPVTLADGRCFSTERQLYLEALKHDSNHGYAYCNLWVLSRSRQVARRLPDGRWLHPHQFLEEALRSDPGDGYAYCHLRHVMPPLESWTHRSHAAGHWESTNQVFATLLLGLQRLEETGVLLATHHSLLEDMLENWIWMDELALGPPPGGLGRHLRDPTWAIEVPSIGYSSPDKDEL